MQPATTRPGAVRRFFAGIRMLGRGFRLWGTSPSLMLLGAIPALIVGAVYVALIVLLALNLGTLATWVTPFAEGWGEPFRTLTRIAAGVAVVTVAILAIVLTYAAITLTVGDPFYERIWRTVENREGGAPPENDDGFWRSLVRGIGPGIRMLLATALIGVALFLGGFVPLVGQTVIPVVAVLAAGWFLTVGLSGYAFDARGFSLRERRRMLATDRAGALGLGVATYLLFLIPFAAIVVMPVAVAGATLFSRSVITSPTKA